MSSVGRDSQLPTRTSGLPGLPPGPRAVRPTIANTAIDPATSRSSTSATAPLPHRDPSTPIPRTTFYPAAQSEAPRLVPPTAPASTSYQPPGSELPTTSHSPVRRLSVPLSTTADQYGSGSVGRPSIGGRSSKAHSDGGSTAAQLPIPEEELMREIVYVMLGSEQTQHSEWSNSEERYILTRGAARQKNMFGRLQEGGALRRKIKRLMTSQSPSFLQQSLKKAVERQLEQHDLFIAALRERNPIRVGDLEVAHHKALPKLHALFVILRDSESAKGGELVTRLQSLHQHGGREMSVFLSDVYHEAVRPLLHMTVHWITKGEIVDPYMEFFISENPAVRESDDGYWNNRYMLREDMLPATLTLQQAKDVLLVGKNIDFIHRCCKAKDWRMSPSIVAVAKAATFDEPQSVAHAIEQALLHTNDAVLYLLFNKNSLGEVLAASRSLFLVATGDLFDLVVDRLEAILVAPAIRIDPSLVEDSIRQACHPILSYLTAPERDAIDHVQVLLDTADRAAVGFDCFTISLPFMKPHNAVLHRAAVAEYQQLFRFLYKVKRVDVLLKKAWRQAIFLDRTQHHQRIHAARQKGGALYKHLNSFVTNVRMYLVTEVIQTAWVNFQRELKLCKSLDDVIHQHDEYLMTLSKRALLDEQYSQPFVEINLMLDSALSFSTLQQQLETFSYAGNDSAASAIGEKFGRIFDDFQVAMSRLLTILEEDTVRFDFLQPLGSRLNFNNFYHVDPDTIQSEF